MAENPPPATPEPENTPDPVVDGKTTPLSTEPVVEEAVIAEPTVSTGPKTVTLTQQALTLWVVGISFFSILVGGALGVSIGLAADSGPSHGKKHYSTSDTRE